MPSFDPDPDHFFTQRSRIKYENLKPFKEALTLNNRHCPLIVGIIGLSSHFCANFESTVYSVKKMDYRGATAPKKIQEMSIEVEGVDTNINVHSPTNIDTSHTLDTVENS